MSNAAHELAVECYGYGRWQAPYWFIGPEEGQGPSENNDLALRHKAFRKLGKDGLSDCRAFLAAISQDKWHREDKTPLQSTWKKLMLVLLAYQGKLTGDKAKDLQLRRAYQRDQLGNRTGETCLIELSGLPARSSAIPRDRESYRQRRLEFLHKKLLSEKPEFVVIYGKSQIKHWEKMDGFGPYPMDIFKIGSTKIAYMPHPVSHGSKNENWISLGLKLRDKKKPLP
jgi:hypothetical protein